MENILRTLLKRGIRATSSHIDPSTVLDGLEFRFVGLYALPIPNTIWQVAEHMQLWIKLKVDLFEGRPIAFPEGHGFGLSEAPASEQAWEQFKFDFKAALSRIEELVETIDLTKRYPVWDDLSAAEIVGMMHNHNSYHAAQIVAMRRVLGVWNRP